MSVGNFIYCLYTLLCLTKWRFNEAQRAEYMKCRRLEALTFQIKNKGILSGITAETALTCLYFIYCVSHRFYYVCTTTQRTISACNFKAIATRPNVKKQYQPTRKMEGSKVL